MHALQTVKLDKVTLNIGAGSSGEKLDNCRTLLERITGAKAILTKAQSRNPAFKVRKGDDIGVKITLRGASAKDVLAKSLEAAGKKIAARSFDKNGTVAFGVKEYIDYPGIRYDSKIGMLGFDVCVTLAKPGARIAKRRVAPRKLPHKQRVNKAEAIEFMKKEFNVNIEE